ncbi:hypothetical protein ACGFNX_40740 [Streptomyces sp. NPDC048723]|uniref:hypothetical protein n=1 Tax=unclassified Streptomyces TaxID=2593676 RepID=UPI003563AADE
MLRRRGPGALRHQVSDYTGIAAVPEAPFKGKITITLISPHSTLFHIEIKVSPTGTASATGNFTLRVNPINQGYNTFPAYAGPVGQSSSTACGLTGRFVAGPGSIDTTGVRGEMKFTVSR